MTIEELDALYDEFNKEFPIESLESMPIEKYTSINNDSFSYWVEFKTKPLGNISGSTSLIYGIYKYKDKPTTMKGTLNNENYSWWKKFGQTQEEAYNIVRQRVVEIANAARSGEYEKIDEIDFGNMYKWKIAYLYSEKKLPNWFAPKGLKWISKNNGMENTEKATMSSLYRYLIKSAGEHNLQEFMREEWGKYQSSDEYLAEIDKENTDKENMGVQYWMYAPGENAYKWEEFYNKGIISIGWGDIGDISKYETRNKIAEALREQRKTDYPYKMPSLALFQFYKDMKPGDIVFVKKGRKKIIGRGVVTGEYQYVESEGDDYNNVRTVNWTHNQEIEHPGNAVLKTLTNITQYTDYVEQLNSLFDIDESVEIETESNEPKYEIYTKDDFLKEVYLESESYDTLKNLLERKKNIILQGPPGVGKTFCAKRLAYSLMGEKDKSRVKMIQFHQSYSYEDFFMGFRPDEDTNGFKLKTGVFYDFCKKAQDDLENKYYFIIDEINRGNLSKIFGELFMLIESDKRGPNFELEVTYKKEKFYVPKNVYIIGMMNTADRSLAMIDYALRRRFSFYSLEPAFESSSFSEKLNEIGDDKYASLVSKIIELNDEISNDEALGKGFCIGHSYLCNVTKEKIQDSLEEIIDYEIIPLLEEYWFDEPKRIEEWSRKLKESIV